MTRAPDWTADEFDTVLQNDQLSNEDVADLLPQRTAEAVDAVRQGIHSYHEGRDDSMLSKMMRQRLGERGGQFRCPVCREPL